MQFIRTRFAAVIAAVLLCLTGVVVAVQSQTTTASAQGPSAGIVHMPTGTLNLQPTQSGTWVNTTVQVTLPRPGTYALDANVRGRIAADNRILASIQARLWNATDSTEVPLTERLITHMNFPDLPPPALALQTTAPISELITVTKETTIRLQVRRVNSVGKTIRADIYSDGAGRTSLRYQRV